MNTEYIYLGTSACVIKARKDTGDIVWRREFKASSFFSTGYSFASLLVEEDRIFVHTLGELFCLNSETGEILWNNPLSGIGGHLGTLASGISSSSAVHAQQVRIIKDASQQ
jgi:outer membrane protein assembly factor BamB